MKTIIRQLRELPVALLCAAGLLLGACGADESAPTPAIPDADAAPLRMGTMWAQESQNGTTTATRAGEFTTYPIDAIGNQMGLVRKQVDPYYASVVKVPYVYRTIDGDDQWAPLAGTPAQEAAGTVWLNHYDATIGVYYPYNSDLTIYTSSVELKAANRSTTAPQEIWYSHFTANNRSAARPLILRQAYARAVVTVVLDEDLSYVAQPKLYKLALSGGTTGSGDSSGIYSTAYLDLFTANGDGNTGYSDYDYKDFTALDARSSDAALLITKDIDKTAKLDLLMIPNTLSEKVTLTLIVGGDSFGSDTKTMTVDIPALDFEGALKAGTIYSIKVLIKGNDLKTVVSATTEWIRSIINGTGTTDSGQKYFDFTDPKYP